MINKTTFAGIRFDDYQLNELVTHLFATDATKTVVTPNVDHVVRANEDPVLLDLYATADISVNDSRVLTKLAGLVGLRVGPVVPGSDLTRTIIEQLSGTDIPVTMIGSSPEAIDKIRQKYALKKLHHYNPPMGFINSPEEVNKCIDFMLAHPSKFIFLAVGSPRQELLARQAREAGATGILLCIGASLMFLSGEEIRAPRIIQKMSLEWLFRMVQSPRRLAKRYSHDLRKIIPLLLQERRRQRTSIPVQANPQREQRILLIAEAANPEWASVPLVGWSQAEALMKKYNCLLVTQVRNRDAILRRGYREGEDFIAIDSEKIARPIDRLGNFFSGGAGKGWTTKMAFNYIAYLFFERQLWKTLAGRIAAGEFSLVHRITPLSPTQPSFLARKCARYQIPFILGPLNGGLPWPKEFSSERRQEQEWLTYIRSAYKLLPGYHATRKHATRILIGSRATWQQMDQKYLAKCDYLPENGIDPQRFSRRRDKATGTPLQAIFVGRLVPYKGTAMLLDGFQRVLQRQAVSLHIVGDGPERTRLEQQAARLGISNSVHFHGWVPHQQVQDYLVNSDLLAFPSIREFGGGVVLEAMALGVMPLIVDYGGPGELVDETTGIKIKLGSKQAISQQLAEVIEQLVAQPEIISEKGQRARSHVLTHFTWERKAEKIYANYQKAWAQQNQGRDVKVHSNYPRQRNAQQTRAGRDSTATPHSEQSSSPKGSL